MVVETEIKTFLEWLLGDSWSQGALLQGGALVACLLVLAGAIGLFFVAVRHRPQWLGNFVGGAVVVSLIFMGLTILVAVPIALGAWMGWMAPWEALKPTAVGVGESLLASTRWLLGADWYLGSLYRWLAVTIGLLGVAELGQHSQRV